MLRIYVLAILLMGMAGCSHKPEIKAIAGGTGYAAPIKYPSCKDVKISTHAIGKPCEMPAEQWTSNTGGSLVCYDGQICVDPLFKGITGDQAPIVVKPTPPDAPTPAKKANKTFTLVHHSHSVQIIGRGIKVNIDYADNDPEAVDVFAQGIADYLNSLGDNPEFPQKESATGTGQGKAIIGNPQFIVPNSGLVSHQQFGGMYYQADPEPNGPCELGHPCTIPFVEPVDVPAITRKRKECIKYSTLSYGNSPPCDTYGDVDYAACEDQTRILLPSQDGVMHCLKFPEAK